MLVISLISILTDKCMDSSQEQKHLTFSCVSRKEKYVSYRDKNYDVYIVVIDEPVSKSLSEVLQCYKNKSCILFC